MTETVHFVPEIRIRPAVAAAFAAHAQDLSVLSPGADIQHIGSTAVPGSLTKGDLDIAVRVAAADFPASDAALASRYERNLGSDRSATFASFKDDGLAIPLGIQLVAIGGPEDFFVQQRDYFLANPEATVRYNALKMRFQGRSMEAYREGKEAYFAGLSWNTGQ